MTYGLHDLVGNIGVLAILIGYLLLQLEKLPATSTAFSLINSVGAGMILISLIREFNLSAFVMEFFWLAMSLVGLARALSRKHSQS